MCLMIVIFYKTFLGLLNSNFKLVKKRSTGDLFFISIFESRDYDTIIAQDVRFQRNYILRKVDFV